MKLGTCPGGCHRDGWPATAVAEASPCCFLLRFYISFIFPLSLSFFVECPPVGTDWSPPLQGRAPPRRRLRSDDDVREKKNGPALLGGVSEGSGWMTLDRADFVPPSRAWQLLLILLFFFFASFFVAWIRSRGGMTCPVGPLSRAPESFTNLTLGKLSENRAPDSCGLGPYHI